MEIDSMCVNENTLKAEQLYSDINNRMIILKISDINYKNTYENLKIKYKTIYKKINTDYEVEVCGLNRRENILRQKFVKGVIDE